MSMDETTVSETPPPREPGNDWRRWLIPLVLALIIIAALAIAFFSTHKNIFGGSATSTPTATIRPGPTGTPRPGPIGTPRPGPTGTPRPGPTGTPRPGPTGTPRPGPTGTPRPGPTIPPTP